ncbi:delta-latroinsectotoxin-Lt1a-like [Amphibalanus amphitrite]|uniref:delta-latroinsectotoxin-Lt1a-like n=1 Tax=Amphibalanus amphitrite TaxID=1232801 RepID=UPI001C8FE499|nr:delta-latroinsectotoxin-Lt1a-like [Amphibalanus amphitrite]XP_043223437.1 delta-latroinsectotoxin-Lt1a-like [Amphibalanus amphitrite]
MFEQARNAVPLENYPVHLACRDGDIQSLTKFVGLRQDKSVLVQEDNFYYWTPLHFASFFGQLPAVIVLREAGVSVDLTTAKFQQTAAHIAAFSGADHCLKYLVHFGCNVNKQDYLGETPLHKAARSGSVACGRVLAADGRALPHLLNTSGQTAAALAAACGHSEMAACLSEYESSCGHLRTDGATAVSHYVQAAPPASSTQPALNGGLVPERAAATGGPWCYQPPPRADTAEGMEMEVSAGEPGRFTIRHEPCAGHQNGAVFSVTVGEQSSAISNGWHGNGDIDGGCANGFGKRSCEQAAPEDIKRRRLIEHAVGDNTRAGGPWA